MTADPVREAAPVLANGAIVGRTVRVSPYEVVAVLDCPDRQADRVVGRFKKRNKAAAAVLAAAKEGA